MTKHHFELDGTFWEVWVVDSDLYTRHGKIGAKGQVKLKNFDSAADAEAHQTKVIAQKAKQGYVSAPQGAATKPPTTKGPPPKARTTSAATGRGEALAQEIYANPDSDDGFAVYADWLQEQGDPRGELAALQARTAKRAKANARAIEQALIWTHRAHLYGPLAPYVLESPDEEEVAVRATWRHGWIDTLELSAHDYYDDELPAVEDVAALVKLLPDVASARFLRELVLVQPVTTGDHTFAPAVKQLVKIWRQLPMLRRLTIGRFPTLDRDFAHSDTGALDPLWPVADQLEYLKINCNRMGLAKLVAPQLRELRIETGGLRKRTIAHIVKARLPALETLSVWFGQPDYGFDGKLADLLPFLDKQRFPALKHLAVANTIFGDELARRWPTASILPQLESLDLSRSHLTVTGMRAMANHREAFAHLQTLDVSRCLLDDEGVELATTLCGQVLVSEQNDLGAYVDADDPDSRYTDVGE